MSRNVLGGLVLALTLAAGAAPDAAAQTASLERVEDLTRLGRTDEARTVLMEWWDSGRGDASRREQQRGLWLRGRLTVDPVQAELDFQRLVVLYPRGPFTPQAIFRLAQSAHARGDLVAARGYVETLARDYRSAPERDLAESWLATAGPAPSPPDARTDRTAEEAAPPRARPTTRPRNRTPPAEERPGEVERPTASAGNYYVQLGAFAEEERAIALYDEVTAAGVDVRIVRVEGSRFLHVRFGRFAERAAAVDELERLTAAGINAALVRDERAEELVRD